MNEVQIDAVEWFDDRCYRIKKDGQEYFIPSVTTQLNAEAKDGIAQWRGDIGNREADLRMHEAADRGKRIHFAWYTYVMGGTVLYSPWQNPLYDEKSIEELKKQKNGLVVILRTQDEMLQMWKLQQFFEKVGPKVLHAELIVYSIERGIAGTMDNAFFIEKGMYGVNGRSNLVIPKTGIYICDLKTGKTVNESTWRQLAPYAVAYQEMGHGRAEGAILLHTGATTKTGIPGFATPFRSADQLFGEDYDLFQAIAKVWKANNPNFGPEIFKFPSRIERRGVNS